MECCFSCVALEAHKLSIFAPDDDFTTIVQFPLTNYLSSVLWLLCLYATKALSDYNRTYFKFIQKSQILLKTRKTQKR